MAASYSDISDALQSIPPDLCREDWWKIAAALKCELGDSGFDLFDQWSQDAGNYKAADTQATWRSTKDSGGIKIGTLFMMAQDHGYRPPKSAHTVAKPRRQVKTSSTVGSAAQAYWDRAEKCISHPYAERKGVDTAGTKKFKGRLLIPAYNAGGKLSSIQEISKDGSKKFLQGCTMSGCWYTLPGDDVLVVAEGWATGKSIHLATGHTAVVAFSSSGFMKVPPLLQQKYPQARIILAPDNDDSQDAVKKATAAARECGCEIIVPEVTDGSDFNDVHQADGLEEIRRQFAANIQIPRLHDLVIVAAADVTPEEVTWLWPGKFAVGKLVLLAGQPSTGKSTLSCSIASIVSTGGKWPFSNDRAQQGRAVILTAEDDLGDTVIPRLIAADADLAMIDIIQSVAGDKPKSFSLAADLHQLAGYLQEQPNTRLIVFDPLSAYLGAQDSHRESDVREVLGPVAQLAALHDVCILGIAHLNKDEGKSAMARILGSTGIVAAARSCYLTARIDDTLMFLPVKNNLAKHDDACGLTYIIRSAIVDGGIESSAVEWTGITDLWAGEAMAQEAANLRAPKTLEAKEFLANYLANGPARQVDIEAAAREAGHAWATIRRAYRELNYESHRTLFSGGWKWYTPAQWKTHQDADQQPATKMLTQSDNTKMLMADEHLGKPAKKLQDAQHPEHEHLGEKTPTSTPLKPLPHNSFSEDAHVSLETAEDAQVEITEKPTKDAKVLISGVLGKSHFDDGFGAV